MTQFYVCICLSVMIVFSVLAVMLRSIIRNAICLAIASAALSMIMYLLGAPWAAMFELSVCSGLITVIFISCISLSHDKKSDVRREYDDIRRTIPLPVLMIASGALLIAGAMAIHFRISAAPPSADSFSELFWSSRQADMWGQIIVMLTGGTAVAVLLKEGKKS